MESEPRAHPPKTPSLRTEGAAIHGLHVCGGTGLPRRQKTPPRNDGVVTERGMAGLRAVHERATHTAAAHIPKRHCEPKARQSTGSEGAAALDCHVGKKRLLAMTGLSQTQRLPK